MRKTTSPSELKRKRIELQSKTAVADGMGGFTDTWVTYATVWARKTTHRSDDAMQAMQLTGIALHNFRIRYRSGVLTSHRIKDGDVYMTIAGPPVDVDQGGQRRWLDLTAKQAVTI